MQITQIPSVRSRFCDFNKSKPNILCSSRPAATICSKNAQNWRINPVVLVILDNQIRKWTQLANLNYTNYKGFCQGGANVLGKGFLRLRNVCALCPTHLRDICADYCAGQQFLPWLSIIVKLTKDLKSESLLFVFKKLRSRIFIYFSAVKKSLFQTDFWYPDLTKTFKTTYIRISPVPRREIFYAWNPCEVVI